MKDCAKFRFLAPIRPENCKALMINETQSAQSRLGTLANHYPTSLKVTDAKSFSTCVQDAGGEIDSMPFYRHMPFVLGLHMRHLWNCQSASLSCSPLCTETAFASRLPTCSPGYDDASH